MRSLSLVGVAMGWLLAAPAMAQSYGFVSSWPPASDTATCTNVGVAMDCTSGIPCVAPRVCEGVTDAGGSVCVPPGALFCLPPGVGSEAVCPDDRPVQVAAGGITVCLSVAAVLCTTGRDARFCFSDAASSTSLDAVDWALGDCDSDGVLNAADTMPCDIRTLAVAGPDGSCTRARRCLDNRFCDTGETCSTMPSLGARRHCLTVGRAVVPCCGGFLSESCPDVSTACMIAPGTSDDFGFCNHFEFCPELSFSDRVKCVMFGDVFGVEPRFGDCDGDGINNVSDVDPCEVLRVDGGTNTDGGRRDAQVQIDAAVRVDAAVRRDAGPDARVGFDGGLRADAAPPDQITFGGGGGCHCAIVGGRTHDDGYVALLSLAILGVVAARSRRRRADHSGA